MGAQGFKKKCAPGHWGAQGGMGTRLISKPDCLENDVLKRKKSRIFEKSLKNMKIEYLTLTIILSVQNI